jgi:hypothetical protein
MYETVYGVGLLDDLHNYFPALLYEQHRFHTLRHVFQYVRSQMDTRFNLYRYGASLYRGQESAPYPIPTVFMTPPSNGTGAGPGAAGPSQADMSIATLLLSLLSTEPTPPNQRATADPWASFRQPVIIRPSQEVLASATERLSGFDLEQETVCTICQDTIARNAEIRRIRHCQHSYHLVCIDQWFERSVVCPTCRHDIRDP